MHRTKWPYWLRGGVIAAGLTVVSGLLILSCAQVAPHTYFGKLVGPSACFPFVIIGPTLPFYLLMALIAIPSFNNPQLDYYLQVVLVIFSTGGWFIIGAAIGVLVGHVKLRKNRTR
jgi:hypothetical protein